MRLCAGPYVALSDDEGENWHIKKLPGTLISQDGIPDTPPCRLYVSRQVSSFGPKAVQAIAKSVMRPVPTQMA